jgi:hypothetical protein
MRKRQAIPTEIRRQILVEAGHRCAIQTCRNSVDIDIHHITPWAQCQEHAANNLIALCPNCHRMADKGKIDKFCLRKYKEICKKLLQPSNFDEINSAHAYIKFNPNMPTEIIGAKNLSSFADIGKLNFKFSFSKPFENATYVANALGDGAIFYKTSEKSDESIQVEFQAPCPDIVLLEFHN